jgi:hypothetical protein
VAVLQSLELVGSEVLMLLTIGHDNAELDCVAINGLPISIQGTAIQDCLFLEVAVGSRGHSESLTLLHPLPNTLFLMAGSVAVMDRDGSVLLPQVVHVSPRSPTRPVVRGYEWWQENLSHCSD